MPVDGRFEHIVLSCNATSDHAIIWIEREAQKALEVGFLLVCSFCFVCLVVALSMVRSFVAASPYFRDT